MKQSITKIAFATLCIVLFSISAFGQAREMTRDEIQALAANEKKIADEIANSKRLQSKTISKTINIPKPKATIKNSEAFVSPIDLCVNAFDMGTSTSPVRVSGSNFGATQDETAGCGSSDEASVWVSYTVPNRGIKSLELSLSGILGGIIRTYEGCGGALTGNSGCSSRVLINCPPPGTVYKILISSSLANSGDFILDVFPIENKINIYGSVYIDINRDSIRQSTENGYVGIKLELVADCLSNGLVIDTVTTSADGTYVFYNIGIGNYMVRIVNPPNADPSGVKDCCLTVDVCTELDQECNLGFLLENCEENAQSGRLCETAPLLCNLKQIEEFCSGLPIMEGVLSGNPFCTDGGIFNNSSWFQFVAGEGDYNFEITPFDCVPGGGGTLGMQAAIFRSCDDLYNPIYCNSDIMLEKFTVPSTGLIPGNIYYFVLDGAAGSICSYTLQITGNYLPFVLSLNRGIELTEQTPLRCQNDPFFSVSLEFKDLMDTVRLADFNNFSYYWTVTKPYKKGGFPIQNYFSKYYSDFGYYMEEYGEYEVCLNKIRTECTEIDTIICKKIMYSNEKTKSSLGTIELTTSDFPWTGDTPDINGLIPLDSYGNPWLGTPIKKTDNTSFPQTFTAVIDADTTTCSYIQEITVKAFFNEIGIYPNPSSDVLTLTIAQPSEISSYKIINHLGKIDIQSSKVLHSFEQLDISSLKPGVYYIQFTNTSGTISKNFTKGL